MARGSKPGERRGGRKRGTPNKITANVREAIEKAFQEVGAHKYLKEQAAKNPTAFMTLLGKVLPTQITGAGGGPIQTIDLTKATDEDLLRLESILSRIALSESGEGGNTEAGG